MSDEISSTVEVKKVKKVVKKKKSVTIDDKISIEGERRDSNVQILDVTSLDNPDQQKVSVHSCEILTIYKNHSYQKTKRYKKE